MEHMKKRGKFSNRSNDICWAALEVYTSAMRTEGKSHQFIWEAASLNPAGPWHVNDMERSQRTDPTGLPCLIKSLDFVHEARKAIDGF